MKMSLLACKRFEYAAMKCAYTQMEVSHAPCMHGTCSHAEFKQHRNANNIIMNANSVIFANLMQEWLNVSHHDIFIVLQHVVQPV